ncbi:hypothetical protein LCGC14_2578790, partial [marine sediment metagenome]
KHPVGRIAFGHVDLSATACPGDNLYTIIPQLTFQAIPELSVEEDDMPLNQEDLKAIDRIVERQVKQRIDDYLLPKMEEKLNERGLVVGGSGGAGLTAEETIEANQEAARRGTG